MANVNHNGNNVVQGNRRRNQIILVADRERDLCVRTEKIEVTLQLFVEI